MSGRPSWSFPVSRSGVSRLLLFLVQKTGKGPERSGGRFWFPSKDNTNEGQQEFSLVTKIQEHFGSCNAEDSICSYPSCGFLTSGVMKRWWFIRRKCQGWWRNVRPRLARKVSPDSHGGRWTCGRVRVTSSHLEWPRQHRRSVFDTENPSLPSIAVSRSMIVLRVKQEG